MQERKEVMLKLIKQNACYYLQNASDELKNDKEILAYKKPVDEKSIFFVGNI